MSTETFSDITIASDAFDRSLAVEKKFYEQIDLIDSDGWIDGDIIFANARRIGSRSLWIKVVNMAI